MQHETENSKPKKRLTKLRFYTGTVEHQGSKVPVCAVAHSVVECLEMFKAVGIKMTRKDMQSWITSERPGTGLKGAVGLDAPAIWQEGISGLSPLRLYPREQSASGAPRNDRHRMPANWPFPHVYL